MAKSPAHILLLALLLGSEPHREALLRVLAAAQVPKGTPPDRIEETMNVDLNCVRSSKTAVRAFDGSRREVNGEIDLLIEKLKFIVEERLITVKGEEDYAIYKETAVPYISVGNDENLPFHSFKTISVIRDFGEIGLSRADRMIGKVLLRHNYIPGTGLGARGQGISRLIEQLRQQRASLLLRIKEEVVKQIDAGFLEVCNYSEWVANIVPVEKKDGRVRVCVDYRDLNKASPKDNFPLPHIDVLVDNTARHAQFSFMDGFSGYNQIRMADEDKIKTTFTTMWGTFCYRVMPFVLKNAGTTYQRAMVTLFHDMMHKEVEVYVDDMIAKSKEGEDHLVNLKRLFDRLKEYKLRLNPAKCTFGARSGKLLGFVVSERGIEVDPDKVKAIRELPPPSSVREVRGFLGRLNYIARFINAAIEWNEECQKAFDTIKAYLIQPPVLVPPTPSRPLILYLTVRRQSLGCMLGQEEESTHAEHAIYYLSKKFTDEESNNPKIEKMCCALVWVMQRLRQYTLYHTTRLLSKADPLKYLLDSPSSMRNIAKWRCQLTEYDIEYVSRTSIKGQAIADHLAEFPIEDNTLIDPNFPDEGILQVDDEREKPEWKMYFDGAVNSTGAIEASEANPWYEDIKNFLRTGQCPPFADRRDRKMLRRLAIHYFLSGKILYRRSFDSTLLRCIDEHESRRLMEEAITLASVTAKAVARFLRRDVIARYGVPATIITDNAKNLNNKVIDELCAQFKIQHRNSIPYRPQMNGAVEAANKNIKKIIEKMTVNYKD
ncbi:hypothetical protein CRG98_009150 [Punica granatum]|uniref:Integrase catalytic domain-containing protein n=1 Tax=Punica granatum TaxID=22663 RepID=A0A2I0KRJ0_PUNGR|nr:hypothetical protein CRG98_009150 [Punica granatum]